MRTGSFLRLCAGAISLALASYAAAADVDYTYIATPTLTTVGADQHFMITSGTALGDPLANVKLDYDITTQKVVSLTFDINGGHHVVAGTLVAPDATHAHDHLFPNTATQVGTTAFVRTAANELLFSSYTYDSTPFNQYLGLIMARPSFSDAPTNTHYMPVTFDVLFTQPVTAPLPSVAPLAALLVVGWGAYKWRSAQGRRVAQ